MSFAIAIILGLGLKAGGFVKSPLFVAIVLVATSLGVIVPVLKDSGNISSSFGQLVIAAASIAEFGAIILLSLFFSGKGSTSTAGTLILLGVFGLVVVLVGLAIAGFERSMSLSRVLRRLQDTTAQIRVRAAFVLLIGFTALAEKVGLETILGAFAAGALLSLIDRDEAMTHPQFRLEARGGRVRRLHPGLLRHERPALRPERAVRERVDGRAGAAVPARDLPRPRPARDRVRATARSLALGDRGRAAGHLACRSSSPPRRSGSSSACVTRASAAGLVAAGLLSVVISPALGLVLLRREQPDSRSKSSPRRSPTGWTPGSSRSTSSATPPA